MDTAIVARELVRAVRGKRSQEAINRRLGFGFNQLHRWERGQTRVKWSDFVDLCEACRLDLAATLSEVIAYFGDPRRTDMLVENLVLPASPSFLKEIGGPSRTDVAHWLAGRSSPRLDQVLNLLELGRSGLLDFVARLVATDLPSLAEARAARAVRRDLLIAHPGLEAVLAVLELESYRVHDDAWVAAKAGMAVDETRAVLALLARARVIERVRKKYVIREGWFLRFDMRSDFAAIQPVKLHWLARATEELARHRGFVRESKFSYYVFSASDETQEKLIEEYGNFLKRVITIVETQTGPRSRPMALGIQLFATEPAGGG
jgi:hypothetical protein